LDPGCGAATFPIRAYSLIRQKNKSKAHKEILKQLFGIDISKFAAHLSMINLTIKDLSEKENYPYIVNSDFFDVFPEQIIKRKYKIKTPSGELAEIKIPHVDAVVGNPPYTRQEEMESAFEEKYKGKLDTVIKKDFHFSIGKRSGIYSYFFIHGSKFLKDGGRFGFITSNSWLDTDYGKYLQEFFLNMHKIIAIIESKVERWFEDADINTCITILERCKDKEERNKNLIKFVQLKVPLKKLVPLTENENERWKYVNKIKEKILEKSEYYEDNEIRIYPKKQEELYFEGYDEDDKSYVGSKWGKYVRAPDIYFRILEKGKGLLIPLRDIAKIRRGYTSGANEFFYLKKSDLEKLSIEKEFWTHKFGKRTINNFVIVSPKEPKGILIKENEIDKRILFIPKDKSEMKGTNILKYIKMGEEKEYNSRPTCKHRTRWYELPERKPGEVLWQMIHFTRHISFYNKSGIYVDHNLFELLSIEQPKICCAILNSTLYALIKEINGRVNLGQGSLKNEGIDIKIIPLIPLDKINKNQKRKLMKIFDEMKSRPIGSIFEEIGTKDPNKVKINDIKRDRLELDNIIFDVLDLTKNERLEVYKGVIDLVKSRIEKAKSVKKKSKKSKIDLELFAENIFEETRFKELKRFPDEYFGDIETLEKELPEGNSAEIENDLFNGLHVKVDGEIVKCGSMEEAKYIKYAVLNSHRIVRIPRRKEDLARIVKEYDNLVTEIKAKAEKILKEEIKDKKLREKIEREISRKIFRR
jgi:hypothetical protein